MKNRRHSILVASAILVLAGLGAPPVPAPMHPGEMPGQAIDSIGRELLGDASFAAHVGEFESRPVLVLDLSSWGISVNGVADVIVNAFSAATCRTRARLVLDSHSGDWDGEVRVQVDQREIELSGPVSQSLAPFPGQSPLCPTVRDGAPRQLDAGLVQALDALGKRLLGDESFAARVDASRTPAALVLDIGTSSAFDVVVNVIEGGSGSACHDAVRLIVEGGEHGSIRYQWGESVQGGHSSWVETSADLSDTLPAPCAGVIADGAGGSEQAGEPSLPSPAFIHTCESILNEFFAVLDQTRRCDASDTAEQCTEVVISNPVCRSCRSFVNPSNMAMFERLAALQTEWDTTCRSSFSCGGGCTTPPPVRGICVPKNRPGEGAAGECRNSWVDP